MRILVSGAGGLLGGRLVTALAGAGSTVVRLVRTRPRGGMEFRWDPRLGILDPTAVTGCDAVVHLAGASIAAGRWSAARKTEILESRVASTRLIAGAMTRAVPPPHTLVCASAVGFYGNRGDDWLDEESPPGEGFLADVVRAWELAAAGAAGAGVRVVMLRFGMVLAAHGGALPRLALPFHFGLGGWLGSGRQWQSWIALDDAVGAIRHVLAHPELTGPVNAVAPRPVTNRELARVLGAVLSRPAVLPLPAWAVRTLLGQMGEELLLFSQRVAPTRLERTGFGFAHHQIEDALRHLLRRRSSR